MTARFLFNTFFTIVVASTFVGCTDLAEECKKIKDNPKLKDPALEKKCIELVDFLPNATNNLANQIVILPSKKTQSEIVVNLIATDQTASPIDTLTLSAITATTQDASGTSTPITINAMERLSDTATSLGTDVRVAFASVIDYSGSIPDDRVDDIETALSNIYQIVQSPFESSVIHFSTDVRVTQDFTTNATLLNTAAKNRTMAREYTSLFDGMTTGVTNTAARTARLRFALTFTDGQDNDSTATESSVVTLAQTHKIPLVMIGVGFADLELLKRMAQQTGGIYVYVPGFAELNSAFELVRKTVLGVYQIKITNLPSTATQLNLSVNTGTVTKSASLSLE